MILTTTAVSVVASLAVAQWGPRVEWEGAGPVAREHASVLPFEDAVVVYAGSGYEPQLSPLGDAWSFDLVSQEWTELTIEGEPPPPGGSKRVAPANNGAFYLFGGYGANFACANDLHRVERRDGALVFTPIEQVSPPPPRALHAFAYDETSGQFLVTLGVAPTGFFADTWVGRLNDAGAVEWTQIESPASPSARFGFPFGFDSDSGELVLFSGQVEGSQDDPMPMAGDLWSFDLRAEPAAWRHHDLDALPAGRRNPCFAFDDVRDRLLIWCGTADARTNVPGLVWINRDGGEWVVRETDDDEFPPRRSSGFGFADPNSDSIVLGFGNSAEGRYTDWVFIAPPTD